MARHIKFVTNCCLILNHPKDNPILKVYYNVPRYVTLLWEKAFPKTNLLYFFFKNVMEYALPEATIGAKWKCV